MTTRAPYSVLLPADAHWRKSNSWHRHVDQDEVYFVLEGTGRLRVGGETLTIPRYGSVLVGAPRDELGANRAAFYPEDPCQLPAELRGRRWPPE